MSNLYTSIPHVGGLAALAHYLGDADTKEYPPTSFVLELNMFWHNYFKFDDEYYLQTNGTSMGSTFAPSYANLYVGLFEECFVNDENPFFL